jgi:D-serine deaminase-like pyridoxal phosphate-dependent protein
MDVVQEQLHDQPRFRAVFEHLGEPGSRRLLATPALVCDLDVLDANIAKMAGFARSAGVALRPHAKSHKSAYVAVRQLRAGAVGLAFAKLSEAEAVIEHLPAHGYGGRVSALLTSPFVGASIAARAWRLARKCDLTVVVDSLEGIDELDAAAPGDLELSVLCDVDVGQGRTGVVGATPALRLAERLANSSALRFGGVQGYAGNHQHVHGKDDRRERLAISTDRLNTVIRALEDAGYDVPLRTGGGTGSAFIDIELGVLNELQCGSYIFMDREYRDALGDDPEGRYAQSLTIETTVISTNHERHVTIDAGLKSMSTDAGLPVVAGSETSVSYYFQGDEHGMLGAPNGTFKRGQRLSLIPPHCDPTVNLYDLIWMVRADTVVDAARVVARGCSQ